MKKIKWILLILMLFLAAVFLFATCKKTNAFSSSNGLDYGKTVYIDSGANISDYTNFLGIYAPCLNSPASNTTYFCISDYGGANYLLFGTYYNSNDNTCYAFLNFGNNRILTTPSRYYKDVLAYVIHIGTNSGQNAELSICLSCVYLVTGDNSSSYMNIDNEFFYPESSQSPQDYISFINAYNNVNGATGLEVKYIYNGTPGAYNGTYNAFGLDCYEYLDDSFSELTNSIYEDYVYYCIKDSSILYNAGYNAGYNSGYQLGYDEGYAAGQTAGYNSGYSVGYQDGLADNTTAYNRGYDDGYADGYRTGYDLGKTDGDAIGYQRGLAEGMAGATPVSQTVGVVSSIFAGIGSVMAIQLFPGFPLGLLILVPLFFAVLGLILWIWRRN